MKTEKKYVPCVRWKQGEYQAIMQLSPDAKNSITPLIEIAEFDQSNPEYAFDHEKGKSPKSIDKHLSPFAERLKSKWGIAPCFVDLNHIDKSSRMSDGQHPVSFVFNTVRQEGISAVPVIGFLQDTPFRNAVRDVTSIDRNGICLRITLEEASKTDLYAQIDSLIQLIEVDVTLCDLILDLEAPPNFEPLDGFASLLESIIKSLPYINNWRSFSLVGTSFPNSLSRFTPGISYLPRYEWRLFRRLIHLLKLSDVRPPNYGDYVINNPQIAKIDPRFMKPKANIRYSIDDNWLVARGKRPRDYTEHRDLCALILKSGHYSGENFSMGDRYILDCSAGKAKTGNLTTWRRVGTNHHLEKVSRDVANLLAS